MGTLNLKHCENITNYFLAPGSRQLQRFQWRCWAGTLRCRWALLFREGWGSGDGHTCISASLEKEVHLSPMTLGHPGLAGANPTTAFQFSTQCSNQPVG